MKQNALSKGVTAPTPEDSAVALRPEPGIARGPIATSSSVPFAAGAIAALALVVYLVHAILRGRKGRSPS